MPFLQTTSTLPAPIAVVVEHHGELQTAYVRRRAVHDRTEAFVGAVSDVLTEDEVRDLSRLFSGSYAATYDSERGAEFGRLLLDELEQSYQELQRVRSRARRWQHLDVTAVVEAIANDVELAALYAQALDERNDTTAGTLVASAVRVVAERASAARNAPDTRRALEAAAAAFRRHATDGPSASPQLALLDEGSAPPAGSEAVLRVWCEALSAGVNAGR